MKKGFVCFLVASLVLLVAIPAFAAVNGTGDSELDQMFQQILTLRKQMIDRYVQLGKITNEQGAQIKENLDAAEQYRQDNPDAIGPGLGGCGGGGIGMMGGYGNGFQGMRGGYGSRTSFGGMMGGYSGIR